MLESLLSSLDLIRARDGRNVEALLGEGQLAAVGQGLVALIARRLQPLHTALHHTNDDDDDDGGEEVEEDESGGDNGSDDDGDKVGLVRSLKICQSGTFVV